VGLWQVGRAESRVELAEMLAGSLCGAGEGGGGSPGDGGVSRGHPSSWRQGLWSLDLLSTASFFHLNFGPKRGLAKDFARFLVASLPQSHVLARLRRRGVEQQLSGANPSPAFASFPPELPAVLSPSQGSG